MKVALCNCGGRLKQTGPDIFWENGKFWGYDAVCEKCDQGWAVSPYHSSWAKDEQMSLLKPD